MADELDGLRVLGVTEAARRQVRPLFDAETKVVKQRVVREVSELSAQIERSLADARQVIERANTDAVSIRETARRAGHREGLEEALALVAEAQRIRDAARADAEAEMLELAFQLAERILGHAVHVDRTAMTAVVRARLQEVRGATAITVRVAPHAAQELEAHRHELREAVDGVPLVFESDPSLDGADCIVETDRGRADARIAVQLAVLRDALQK